MKYGLMIEKETRNIGDDIQSYAASRFLPRVDYLIDRNHIDEFVPGSNEYVATILNGWFLQYVLNWPLSPFIKPLPISMHFTYKNWFWDIEDRAYHLMGYGLDYLKSIEPIGCRDNHTQQLLTGKGVKTTYTGCLTLTLEKFENIEKGNYICAVDVSEEVIKKIKENTSLEVKEVTHIVPEDYYKLPWDERMKKVEELLKLYQGATAVVSYRLHCALPCLALGTPTILLNEEQRNDRFGDYIKYIESCSEEEFISGKVKYDFENIPKHSNEWTKLRDNLIEICNNFINDCENNIYEYKGINIQDYTENTIKKSNWLKEAVIESYNRFKDQKKSCKFKIDELEKEKKDLKEKNEFLEKENERQKQYYQNEFDDVVRKMEKYKNELEMIKNSRWWKLRNKLKGNNDYNEKN